MTRADFDNLVKQVTTRYPSADQKADAADFVATRSDLTPDLREALWRYWCRATHSSVLRSELTRVREARHANRQTSLF